MKKVLLTTAEVCNIFMVSKQTIFRYVKDGKLSPIDKTSKKWLFRVKDIEEFIGDKIEDTNE